MKLYRFKSNKNTIVQRSGKHHVQTVWADDYKFGPRSGFLYRTVPDNLIPLTDDECQEIVALRTELGLVLKIGQECQPIF